MRKGLCVKLSSHAAGHSDEAPPGHETWYLPQAQSVSTNTYRYHNARKKKKVYVDCCTETHIYNLNNLKKKRACGWQVDADGFV